MSRSEGERFAAVVHEYFRVSTQRVLDIVDHQLAALAAAIRRH